MNLYLSREGQTFGPYTVDQAREYLAAGQFLPNDYALFEGQIEWKSLGELIGTETSQPEAEPDLAVVEPTREEVQEVAEATGLEHRSPGEVQPQKNPQSSDSNRKRPKKIGGRNKGRSVVAKPQRRSLSSKIISTLVVFLITALVFGGIVTGLYFVMPEKVAPLLASLGLPVGEEKNEQDQNPGSGEKAEISTSGELMLDEDQAQRLRISGIRILPMKEDTGLQIISSLDPKLSIKDDDLSALAPVASQLVAIDLTQSKITDRGLGQLIEMKNLKRLTLEGVKEITPDGIAKLKPLESLSSLNLVRVPLDDSLVDVLIMMENLREVYLFETGLSETAISRLKTARPKLFVIEG